MNTFNIYLTGVGGQGIGLLTEILMRAADHAGLFVKAVDTHGLAQRGGVVVSQIRIGEEVNSPLIRKGEADLVLALERNEALRGSISYLRDGGALLYYNVVWQPLDVRLRKTVDVSETAIESFCRDHDIRIVKVPEAELEDARMQNIVVLSAIHQNGLIPGLDTIHFEKAMRDLLEKPLLEKNLALFNRTA